ncbi:POU domain class 2-associating factor 2 isoform X2 [Lepisosteus oculatus]
MSGSHMLPSYYGMRRSFISDPEFSHCHPSKPFAAEVYSSSLSGKPLSCEPSAVSGYSSLIDSYYPDSFGDYRSAAFSTGGSPIFPPAALPSLLPPFSGESSHFLLRDSWEQTGPDSVSQGEGLCSDAISSVPSSGSLTNPESGSPTQYRGSSRSSGLASSQPYSLHSLDEVHYPVPYPGTPSYSCPPYMTVPNDLAPKMPPLSSEESDNPPPSLNDTPSWAKEDGSSSWSPYEIRRAY